MAVQMESPSRRTTGVPVPAVRLTGVTKDFGQVHAVRGVDLVLEPGEVVAFLGPNGAGKTTTIDVILGLSRPTAGSAEVFGMEPRKAIARGLVAAVMQTGGLLKDLSVRETVEYTASLFADTRPVGEVLASAGIASIADRKVAKCSGGEPANRWSSLTDAGDDADGSLSLRRVYLRPGVKLTEGQFPACCRHVPGAKPLT